MGFESPPLKLVVVIPVYDDWISLRHLLRAIDDQSGFDRLVFDVLIVNDGSPTTPTLETWSRDRYAHINNIRLLNVICNLGHQRAIAVGLVMVAKELKYDGVIVMDCDGEDRAEDIPKLIGMAKNDSDKIVCAWRSKRSESLVFKAFYLLYKILFRILAGISISFGNFCYIPRTALQGLVHSPSLWNHLAATLVRSRVPLILVPTARGRRYVGGSKMNLGTLVTHGLSAISVYADVVLVRITIGMLGVAAITIIGLGIVAAIKLFTDLAIPGWASAVFGSLSIVLLQSIIFAIISAFLLLSARSAKPVIPIIDAPQFVASLEQYDISRFEEVRAS